MINLKKLYEERGLTIESNEFPDYLPMFLEFLSGLNDAEAQALLDGAARHIAAIDVALKKEESPWAVVTGAIMSLTAMKNSEVKFERDDLLPTTEAESFDSPVRFEETPIRYRPCISKNEKSGRSKDPPHKIFSPHFFGLLQGEDFRLKRHHPVIEIIS